MKLKCVLMVGQDGGVRVLKGYPARPIDEFWIAIPLTVNVPDGWFRRMSKVIDVNVPEPDDRGDVTIETGDPPTEAQP